MRSTGGDDRAGTVEPIERTTRSRSDPLTLSALDPAAQRRKLASAVVWIASKVALLVAAFYIAPFDRAGDEYVVVRVVIAIAIVGGAAVVAFYGIERADFPMLRAVQGVSTVVVVAMLMFASTYVLISNNNPNAFTESLGHTDALYFTIATASTVGYGDIAAQSETARLVATVQMVFDLILIGAVLRLLFNTAKRRVDAT